MEDAQLDDLETRLVAFIRAFGLHRPDRTPCGQPLGPSDAHALAELGAHGPLAQHDLTRRLRLEKSTVSRLVGGLETRGWIERVPHPADGRARLLRLTEAGERVARRLHEARRAKFARLRDALPEAQRPAVLAALHTLVEALDREPDPT